MAVDVHWDGVEPVCGDAALARAADAALEHGGRGGLEVVVVLVDDPALTDMHTRYLDDPTPTDVITFDLGEEDPGPAGELYVSVDCARRVAAQRGVPVERELALYVVHGALHLCGFDDHEEDDRARMRAAEREVMAGLGYAPDDAPHERAGGPEGEHDGT